MRTRRGGLKTALLTWSVNFQLWRCKMSALYTLYRLREHFENSFLSKLITLGRENSGNIRRGPYDLHSGFYDSSLTSQNGRLAYGLVYMLPWKSWPQTIQRRMTEVKRCSLALSLYETHPPPYMVFVYTGWSICCDRMFKTWHDLYTSVGGCQNNCQNKSNVISCSFI